MIVMDDVGVTLGRSTIIKNLCLSIQSGEMTLFIGPALQGILSAVCGQIPLDAGRIEVDGFPVNSDAARQKMVCVFEKPLMNPYLTPRKNLSYYLKLRGVKSTSADLDSYAKGLLLHEFVDSKVSILGHGIVRGFETLEALIAKPKYYILCDFTASFFVTYIKRIPGELASLLQSGTGILSSTPSLELARALSNHLPIRVVVLSKEGVLADGPIDEILNQLPETTLMTLEPPREQPKSFEIAKAIEALKIE
ncbi:MAG: hypothetical protein P1Q69_16825 [Candidatus Thorarchaeota archaeon]|nr:hypothetical protein [Candidatus Thorarchaeota archaeon]